MKRKTWAWVVLGGAIVVGIILAVFTQPYIRPGSDKTAPDPRFEVIEKLKLNLASPDLTRPPEADIKTLKDLATAGGDFQKSSCTLALIWLRRMHDEKSAEEPPPPEYRELAEFLLANDPSAAEGAVKVLQKSKTAADRSFEMNLLATFGKTALPAVMAAFEEDARKPQDDYHLAATSVMPDVLAVFGVDALPRLRTALKNQDPAIRRQALRALALLAKKWDPERTVEAVPDVEKAIADTDKSVRAFAVLAWGELARRNMPRAPVQQALYDNDPHVRLAAVYVLARHGSSTDPKSVAMVVVELLKREAFKDTWWNVVGWQQGLEELASWKTAGGPIRYSPLFWEETAANVLLDLSTSFSLPPESIVQMLKTSPHDGRHLIEMLAAQGKTAAPVVPELVKMLKDPDALQRRKALLALGRLGREVVTLDREADGDAVLDVLAAFENPELGSTRWQAFLALMQLDPELVKSRLPPSLRETVDQMSATVKRTNVTNWTGTIWRDSPAILVPVRGVQPRLDSAGVFHTPIDRDIEAENERIDGMLAKLAKGAPLGKDGVSFLLAVWQGTARPKINNTRHGEKALALLVREGAAAKIAVPHLMAAWSYYDAIEPEKKVIANGLFKIGEVAVPFLAAALGDDKKRDLHLRILEVFQAMGPKAKAAVPALVKALQDKDEKVGFEAVKTFDALGADGKAAIPALLKLLPGDSPIFRRRAATALGLIGPEAKAAVPALIGLFMDDSQETRVVAKRAVKSIGKDAVEPLIKALADPREKVRLGAVETLALMPPAMAQPALSALQKLAGTDQPAEVRDQAVELVKTLQAK